MYDTNRKEFRQELDYYIILGVSETSTRDEIRSSYRRLELLRRALRSQILKASESRSCNLRRMRSSLSVRAKVLRPKASSGNR